MVIVVTIETCLFSSKNYWHGSNNHRGGTTSPLGHFKALRCNQSTSSHSRGKSRPLEDMVEIPAPYYLMMCEHSGGLGVPSEADQTDSHMGKKGDVWNHRVLISWCNDLPCFWKYPNKNRCSGDLDSSNRRRSC